MEEKMHIYTLDTEPAHVKLMGDIFRERDVGKEMPIPAHRALWRAYKNSLFCKTVFVDGAIAAIWGICAEPMSDIGRPWMVASSIIDDYPLRVAFRYRKELKDMLKCFPVLEDWVEKDNVKAVRLLSLLGFNFVDSSFVKNDRTFVKATMVG